MEREIMHCGHKFVLRDDGLYEAAEYFEMSESDWIMHCDSAGCLMIFKTSGSSLLVPWILCTDKRYVDAYHRICDNEPNCVGTIAFNVPIVDKDGVMSLGGISL